MIYVCSLYLHSEINNMGIWYRMGDVLQQCSQETAIQVQCDGQATPVR